MPQFVPHSGSDEDLSPELRPGTENSTAYRGPVLLCFRSQRYNPGVLKELRNETGVLLMQTCNFTSTLCLKGGGGWLKEGLGGWDEEEFSPCGVVGRRVPWDGIGWGVKVVDATTVFTAEESREGLRRASPNWVSERATKDGEK